MPGKLVGWFAKHIMGNRNKGDVNGALGEILEIEGGGGAGDGFGDLAWAGGWLALTVALGVTLAVALARRAHDKKPKSYRIKDLIIYPIKSCKGIRLESSPVAKTGLQSDRLFMLADSETGKFVSQRKYPRMCLIGTSMENIAGTTAVQITVSAPGMTSKSFPLAAPAPSVGHKRTNLDVWGEKCVGFDLGDEFAQWFSTVLGLKKDMFKGWPVRFVRISEDPADRRPTDPT
jgi:hypothetical protein